MKQDDEIPFGVLDPDEAVLVEGEVKAMVLDQLGFTAAGTPGFNAWTTQWKDFFKGYQTVYIAFDPGDTLDKAFEIAETLRTVCYQVRIATLPVKPDDFFVRYGGNIDDFVTILKQGRLVR
ncbi:MAG: hypothetical protein GTO60_04190 [Gammaproteobacteria bacterium]|nr:hypothetical protein [Gammaproteobacteria bacterium]